MVRMHSVSPASGVGGGDIDLSGGGDRALLRNVSDNGLLQQMLRRTPAGGGGGLATSVSIPALLRMLGPTAGRSRVPLVAPVSRSGVLNAIRALLGNPTQDLDAVDTDLEHGGVLRRPDGTANIHGYSMTSWCSNNSQSLSGSWTAGPGLFFLCGAGWTPQDFRTVFAGYPSRIAELNNQDQGGGFPVGKRRVFGYEKTAPPGVTPLGRRSIVRSPRYLQPGPAVSVDRKPSPTVRRHRAISVPGYKRQGHEIVVSPGPSGEITVGGPPTKIVHREVKTKREKKTAWLLGRALLGAYHTATEIGDLVDALADAIPGKPCYGLPGFRKLVCVIEHWEDIDPETAVENIIANEIEDRLVGRFMGQLGKLTKVGGPNVVQMTQWTRTLGNL